MTTETHPLKPFLPSNARLLMLGSFPPPKTRWCMEFFYPNWNNDMWRIWGYLATGNKDHFVVTGEKRFDKEKIEQFCHCYGIALYDTAQEVIRLKENASDQFLQIVTPTDVADLLQQIPYNRGYRTKSLRNTSGYHRMSYTDSRRMYYS